MRLLSRRSRVKWVCATVAPWALASGLLLSFTASAGNDPRAGVSAAPRGLPGLPPALRGLVPPSSGLAFSPLLPGFDRGRALSQGSLDLSEGEPAPPAMPLRSDWKQEASPPPLVERSGKGDPAGRIDVSLSRRAGDVREALSSGKARLMFGRDERLLPPTILLEGSVEAPNPGEPAFEPWSAAAEATATRPSAALQSPRAAAAGSTGAAGGATTPTVGRAVALSSTTPAPADATPVEIAAAPVSGPQSLRAGGPRLDFLAPADPDRPRYASLIDPDKMDKEQRCLAEAVYFEARSEPEDGQAAVAQVVLNRVRSGLYPASICGVVYQNRNRHLACQFTFACEGKSLRTTDRESWATAKRIAGEVLEGRTYLAEVGASTHYHADYVRPRWARKLKRTDVIGRHIFYRLRPGQT